MKKGILVLIAILAISAPAFAQTNLLTNGSFDDGSAVTGYGNAAWSTLYDGADEVTGWTFWDYRGATPQTDQSMNFGLQGTGSAGGKYSALRDGATGSALTIYTKGCNTSGWSCGVYQTVDVTAGAQYALDGWWTNFADSNLHAYWYEIGVIQGDWINNPDTATYAIWKGGKGDTNNNFDWKKLSDTPQQFANRGNEITVNQGVRKLTVYIKTGVDAPSELSNKERLRVDDLTLIQTSAPAPVPEPGTLMAAFSVLAPAGLLFRRKK